MTMATLSPFAANTSAVSTSSFYIYPLPATVVIGLLTSLLAVATTVFNGLTFLAFAMSGSLRNFGDYFILNLAVADFAIGVLSIPPYIPYTLTGRWMNGTGYCFFWLLWDYITPAASTYSMCVISIDRYLLVAWPIWYRQHQSSRLLALMLLAPWAIATAVYVPSILLWEELAGRRTIRHGQCHVPYADNLPFLLFGSFIEFMLPFVVMGAVNLLVFLNILRRARRRVAETSTRSRSGVERVFSTQVAPAPSVHSAAMEEANPNAPMTDAEALTSTQADSGGPPKSATPKAAARPREARGVDNRNRRAARSLFILVLVFALCWMPYEVLALIVAVCPTCVDPLLFEVSFWLLWANSTINPILYPLLHRRFREAFFTIVRKVRCLLPQHT